MEALAYDQMFAHASMDILDSLAGEEVCMETRRGGT